tara:strand:+ start:5196 stop:6734 length:1539 start_codon:yes stop_codon:yes gene_type:complete
MTINPYTFISPDGSDRVATSMNMSNMSEFMHALNTMTVQYALGDVDQFAGTNSFPAIVLTEPLVLDVTNPDNSSSEPMETIVSALGDNAGVSFGTLTNRGITQTTLFKARVIGYPGRPGPDDCLPLPDNMNIEDPVTRSRLRQHKTFYWWKSPEEEMPTLAIGDVVMVTFENRETFDNGYATHIIERTETPGAISGDPNSLSADSMSLFDMQSLFSNGSAREILAAGESGPTALEASAESLAAVQSVVDELCRWTGPYPLTDGSGAEITGVYIQGVLVKESEAGATVLLLRGMQRDGLEPPRFNSGWRPAYASAVRGGAAPAGQITAGDMEGNTIGETTPANCKDWDGRSPSRANPGMKSQELLMWRNCNPSRGRRGQEGYPSYFDGTAGDRAGTTGANACSPLTGRPSATAPHGTGRAMDINVGSRGGLDDIGDAYMWLINNAWKYGFIRTVRSERWHWEYRPGTSMFRFVANDHETWNSYFTTAGRVPISVPPTSPVQTEEDVIASTGDL